MYRRFVLCSCSLPSPAAAAQPHPVQTTKPSPWDGDFAPASIWQELKLLVCLLRALVGASPCRGRGSRGRELELLRRDAEAIVLCVLRLMVLWVHFPAPAHFCTHSSCPGGLFAWCLIPGASPEAAQGGNGASLTMGMPVPQARVVMGSIFSPDTCLSPEMPSSRGNLLKNRPSFHLWPPVVFLPYFVSSAFPSSSFAGFPVARGTLLVPTQSVSLAEQFSVFDLHNPAQP